MTITSARVEEYLQWLAIDKGRARATLDAYRRDLNGLMTWLTLHGRDVENVRESDLERYVSEMRSTKRAPNSVARALAAVHGLFAYCLDEGYLTDDPSAHVRAGPRGRTLPKPLGEEEVITMLDAIGGPSAIDWRDRALLELLYDTGARVSEVVGLDLSDLDFDEELILLNGKGGRQRLVPLGATLRSALLAYLAPGGRASLVERSGTSRVFVNARGGALTRQGIDLVVHKRARAVGIERGRVSAHVFRHSCATHMLAHGADIRVVQELLGHASIATTQLYTAVSVTTLQREYLQAHPRAHD